MAKERKSFLGRIARSFKRFMLDGTARRFRGYQRDIVERLQRDKELAVELLVQRVQDKNEDSTYRTYIPLLLGKLGGDLAARACLNLLQDPAEQGPVRRNAVEALSEMGLVGRSPFFDTIVSCVSEKTGYVEHTAAKALCRTARPEVIPHVAEYLFLCSSSGLRSEIEKALSELDSQWATSEYARQLVPTLLSVFRGGDLERQRMVVKYMEQIADSRFADALREAVERGQGTLSYDAEAALSAVAKRHDLKEHLVFLRDLERARKEEEQGREQQRRAEESRRAQQVRELRHKIRTGMKLREITAVLGPPSSHMGGGDLLGTFGSVSGSASAISSVSQRQYYVWRRPEGEWKLVFIGDELVDVYSTP